MSVKRLANLVAIFIAFVIATPQSAAALGGRNPSTTHGRFAFGYYSISDTAPSHDVSVTHFYYRLIGEEIPGFDNITYNLDGRMRSSSADYRDDIPSNRLLVANVEIKDLLGGHLDIALGRSFIKEFVSQNVDGVNARFRFSKDIGIGAFGGARPDPYDDIFNTDFSTFGGYLFQSTDLMDLSVGYALDMFNGEKDRERANGFFTFMPSTQWFHVNASIDLDNDSDIHEGEVSAEGWEITNILLDGSFRPDKTFVISFTYNNFRAINREASFEHVVGEEVLSEERYSIARAGAEFRPYGGYALYGGMDMRIRDVDEKSATQFYVGARATKFIFGSRLDVKYSDMEWFTSQVTAIRGDFGFSMKQLDFDITATYMTNTQDGLENEMVQWVYDFSANWWYSKEIYVVGTFTYSTEEFLDIDTVYTTRYDDNFSTTSIYFQAGYRF